MSIDSTPGKADIAPSSPKDPTNATSEIERKQSAAHHGLPENASTDQVINDISEEKRKRVEASCELPENATWAQTVSEYRHKREEARLREEADYRKRAALFRRLKGTGTPSGLQPRHYGPAPKPAPQAPEVPEL